MLGFVEHAFYEEGWAVVRIDEAGGEPSEDVVPCVKWQIVCNPV